MKKDEYLQVQKIRLGRKLLAYGRHFGLIGEPKKDSLEVRLQVIGARLWVENPCPGIEFEPKDLETWYKGKLKSMIRKAEVKYGMV